MGSSALKAILGWLTLFPLIDEKGKASGWDKCLVLALQQKWSEEPGAVESPAAALHTCMKNILAQH